MYLTGPRPKQYPECYLKEYVLILYNGELWCGWISHMGLTDSFTNRGKEHLCLGRISMGQTSPGLLLDLGLRLNNSALKADVSCVLSFTQPQPMKNTSCRCSGISCRVTPSVMCLYCVNNKVNNSMLAVRKQPLNTLSLQMVQHTLKSGMRKASSTGIFWIFPDPSTQAIV